MTTVTLWSVLGIAPTRDRAAIRRAYATRLKGIDPEADAEGFQALRAAYELALRLAAAAPPPGAASIAAASTDAAAPTAAESAQEPAPLPPTPVDSSPAPSDPFPAAPISGATDAALAAGQAAFTQLAASLARDADPTLRATAEEHFATVADVIAQLDITRQSHAEQALADLLMHHLPQADVLLVRAADRFGWRESGRGARNVFGYAAVRLKALELEAELASRNHRLSSAYRLLRAEPRPHAWRVRALVLRADRHVAELLEVIESGLGGLVPSLHPQALTWWRQYLGTPRITRASLAIAGGIALLIGALLVLQGMNEGTPPVDLSVRATSAALLAGAIAIPVQLYLIEWPRWRLRQRWAQRLPKAVAYGWFPSALLLLLIAGFLPSTWSLFTTFPLAILIALWAHITEPPLNERADASARFKVIRSRIRLNIPLAICLVASAALPDARGCSLTALALAAAVSLGHGSLYQAWRLDHGSRQRWLILALLPLIAVLLGAGLVLHRIGPLRAELALTIALVFIQRPLSAGLTGQLAKIRYYILFGAIYVALGLTHVLGAPQMSHEENFVHAATIWFTFGVLVSGVCAIVHERDVAAGLDP